MGKQLHTSAWWLLLGGRKCTQLFLIFTILHMKRFTREAWTCTPTPRHGGSTNPNMPVILMGSVSSSNPRLKPFHAMRYWESMNIVAVLVLKHEEISSLFSVGLLKKHNSSPVAGTYMVWNFINAGVNGGNSPLTLIHPQVVQTRKETARLFCTPGCRFMEERSARHFRGSDSVVTALSWAVDLLPTGEFQYSVSRGQEDRWKCKMTILVDKLSVSGASM